MTHPTNQPPQSGTSGRLRRLLRPQVLVPALVVGVVLAALGAYLFQPWKLFVDVVVDEALPEAAGAADGKGGARDGDTAEGAGSLRVLATGRFISHEHQTSGRVRVLQLPDASRVLRIEDLDTSNGPDLRVWLSDAEVIRGRAGWFVFDDGRHVDLGALRGNLGSQNYPIPAYVDLDDLRSVSIWCRRFHVSFGAAELTPRA